MNHVWPQFRAARYAASRLHESGFEAYIIGGAVRDILLGVTPKDFDLVTNATPDEVLRIPGFEKSRYIDSSQAYGVTRVRIPIENEDGERVDSVDMELATYRRDVEAHLGRKQTKVEFSHLEDDVERRDFTVNALALDPATNQLIDLVGGLEDIEQGLVRFIGDPDARIHEDPLRVLRAIRIKNQLDFQYEDATRQALRTSTQTGVLEHIPVERLRFELTSMLMSKYRYTALVDLDALEAMPVLLPEVAAQKNVPQPQTLHAEGDVWTHCKLTMSYLPDIISPRLAWAALLHDTGKVTTIQSAEETGDRIRFNRHYAEGAGIAHRVLKRLGFGKRFRQEVAWMAYNHMSIDELPRMRPGRAKHMMSHPAFGDLLELHKADAHAAWSVDATGSIDKGPADFSTLENIWADFQQQQQGRPPSLKHDLGIDGRWLMERFDIDPGPRLGTVLTQLEEKYLDGEIRTPKEAEANARRLLELE